MPQWIALSHLPHNVLHSPSIFMFIYLYGMCVFHIIMHSALFVRDAIFPHVIHVERS